MAATMELRSYGDATRIQDVQPLVEILTAKENWFLSNLGKSVAKDTIHGVLTDTLRTVATAAVEESADYTNLIRTTPTRTDNIVQNIAIPFRVGRTQQLIQHLHGQNEKARQLTKAMMDWANAAEYDILRSTLVSGVSGTAPQMKGILQAISKSTNVTVQTTATVFSASILKGLLRTNWANSNGEPVTDLFMGGSLKATFDGFTAGATKFMQAGQEVKDFVDVYDGGGFGRVMVHLHRYITDSSVSAATDTVGRVLGIRREKISLAYLETAHVDELARSGDYDAMAVIGKLTVEVRNQDTNFLASGYLL